MNSLSVGCTYLLQRGNSWAIDLCFMEIIGKVKVSWLGHSIPSFRPIVVSKLCTFYWNNLHAIRCLHFPDIGALFQIYNRQFRHFLCSCFLNVSANEKICNLQSHGSSRDIQSTYINWKVSWTIAKMSRVGCIVIAVILCLSFHILRFAIDI